VIEKRVPSIEVPSDAARLDVPGDALGRVEVEGTAAVRATRKRRHRENTREILEGYRPADHLERISRNSAL
jgi:hypothetical protein